MISIAKTIQSFICTVKENNPSTAVSTSVAWVVAKQTFAGGSGGGGDDGEDGDDGNAKEDDDDKRMDGRRLAWTDEDNMRLVSAYFLLHLYIF